MSLHKKIELYVIQEKREKTWWALWPHKKTKAKQKDAKRKRNPEAQGKDAKRKQKSRLLNANAPKKDNAVQENKHEYMHKDNIDIEINKSVKKTQKYIKRKLIENNINLHKALVCVICDVEITGTERVCHVSRYKL